MINKFKEKGNDENLSLNPEQFFSYILSKSWIELEIINPIFSLKVFTRVVKRASSTLCLEA